MNIGLYFGSFNPIHVGHLIIANSIAEFKLIDQVWIVVSPQNPLKPSNSLLNEYHRLHLVKTAIENNTKLKATDIEFKLPKPSYTIDTLTYLREKYSSNKFSVILGSDSWNNLHKWKNSKKLIEEYDFIVYKRPNFEIFEYPNAKVTIMKNMPLLEISSTVVRNKIKEGFDTRYLLTEKVHEEVMKNNYYK